MKVQVCCLKSGDKVKFMTGMGIVKSCSVPVKLCGRSVCVLDIEVNGHIGRYRWYPKTLIKIHNDT